VIIIVRSVNQLMNSLRFDKTKHDTIFMKLITYKNKVTENGFNKKFTKNNERTANS